MKYVDLVASRLSCLLALMVVVCFSLFAFVFQSLVDTVSHEVRDCCFTYSVAWNHIFWLPDTKVYIRLDVGKGRRAYKHRGNSNQ